MLSPRASRKSSKGRDDFDKPPPTRHVTGPVTVSHNSEDGTHDAIAKIMQDEDLVKEVTAKRCEDGMGYDPEQKRVIRSNTGSKPAPMLGASKNTRGFKASMSDMMSRRKKGPGKGSRIGKRGSASVRVRAQDALVMTTGPYVAFPSLKTIRPIPDVPGDVVDEFVRKVTRLNIGLRVLSNVELTKAETTVAATALSLMYERDQRGLTFANTIVDNEIGDKASGAPFRSNSLAVKTILAYHSLVGIEYLRNLLSPVIYNVRDMSVGDVNLEADESKLSSKARESLAEDRTKIVMSCQTIMMVLLKSLSSLPFELRRLYSHIDSRLAGLSMPEQNRASILFGVFFQRFLCPALLSPNDMEICEGEMSPISHKILTIISRFLSSFSLGKTFGDAGTEAHLTFLNEVLGAHAENRMNVYNGLLAIEKAREAEKTADSVKIVSARKAPSTPHSQGSRPRKSVLSKSTDNKMSVTSSEEREAVLESAKGSSRRSKVVKGKEEIRGNFELLDPPPQTFQDLRAVIGLKFFDFCKYWDIQATDNVDKLFNAPETKWKAAPFPVELVSGVRLNIANAEEQRKKAMLSPPGLGDKAREEGGNDPTKEKQDGTGNEKENGDAASPPRSVPKLKVQSPEENVTTKRTLRVWLVPLLQENIVAWEEEFRDIQDKEVSDKELRENRKNMFGLEVTKDKPYEIGRGNRLLNIDSKTVSRVQAVVTIVDDSKDRDQEVGVHVEGRGTNPLNIRRCPKNASFTEGESEEGHGDANGEPSDGGDQAGESKNEKAASAPGVVDRSTWIVQKLKKTMSTVLQNGDVISLVPGSYEYEVYVEEKVETVVLSPQSRRDRVAVLDFASPDSARSAKKEEKLSYYDEDHHEEHFRAIMKIIWFHKVDIHEVLQEDRKLKNLWKIPEFDSYFES
mmetsp:Transcript_28832/g.80616  ORF Transcript_28832/g.80616 Transcript_28832/m.80616 type:complete len:910 (+) Transcript_28832:134-2863(+)|eukprot:CAMPEP_0119150354 /NCGR_PEP_ID=MMETSP1310-20130426/44664_1 /TAXON_ID=464262 /ORGANISM="Genus nov. species nov., Strain RCC2339" /LENGTH=909 /DNA_ID=CAMNT_0007142539 /DNA_START=56 /DNA_END=2785 /DNA_ORIENTATION=-